MLIGIEILGQHFLQINICYVSLVKTKVKSMNIQALKYEIIEWVIQTQDNSLLEALKSIKDSNASSTNWFDELSLAEKESINRGKANHEQGEVLTNKEFWAGYEDKV
ncbi:hypothetical protein [Adhaeribacter rhizoryzae]|uniref:Uncharacterized protein n=1 Tax=Adhaeribacter rhizoryzae TaxID=2607907 RepID=A0A5M6DFW4_9BACT|nr:hypothetical protein [Adhaeribacter rhizoryzae]KAA5545079.1 hypothetical protein F0145_13585 [Adhaeribacter rhizoryzae]